MSDATEVLTVQEGQAAVKQVAVSGEITSLPSATDVKAIVQTDKGPVAAIKTVSLGGGGGGSGGDYLPLSGGTMAGPIEFTGVFADYFGRLPVFRFNVTGGSYTTDKTISVGALNSLYLNDMSLNSVGDIVPGGTNSLGLNVSKWDTIYVTKIYNGGTIDIPAKSGTMALTSDIDKVVGDISTALTAIIGE